MSFNIIQLRRVKFENTKKDHDKCYDVFFCHKCGIHPKAISVLTIDGDEEKKVVQCKNYKPGKIEIKHTLGSSYNLDGKLTEEIFCGKCGYAGRIVKIPKQLVDLETAIGDATGGISSKK